jgi:hypothetical protein
LSRGKLYRLENLNLKIDLLNQPNGGCLDCRAFGATKRVANVIVLKNGNVKAAGMRPRQTHIIIDINDSKDKHITHKVRDSVALK